MATSLPTSRGTSSRNKDYTVECTISDVAPFTVHFRQPKDMAGRYGFDYPRDADRYPIEEIFEDVSNPIGFQQAQAKVQPDDAAIEE